MTTMEDLMQAVMAADEGRRAAALKLLRGEATEPAREVERYLSVKEVCARFNVSACSLWRWEVPCHAFGGRRRYLANEVQAYLDSDAYRRKLEELRTELREQRARATARELPRRKRGAPRLPGRIPTSSPPSGGVT